MNRIKVLFFATLRDRAGTRAVDLEISAGTTIAQLKVLLVKQFPSLGTQDLLEHCLAAIDHEYRFDDTVVPENAEVALFPPVSGG